MSTADAPLILLPGTCCDAWFFRLQAQAFSRRRDGSPRHVIVPDWIAHVDPRDGTGSLQRVAARLATAWHDADLDGAVVVGHSLGGIVGTVACSTGRFKPGALLLLDSAIPIPRERRPFLVELGTRMAACADPDPSVQRERLRPLIRDYVLQQLAAPTDDRDTLDEVIEHMTGGDPLRGGTLLKAAASVDLTIPLRRVDTRVSAIAADPARLPVDLFRACRPNAEVLQIRSVGHFIQLLAADTVNAAIACILDGSPLRGAGLEPLAVAGTITAS